MVAQRPKVDFGSWKWSVRVMRQRYRSLSVNSPCWLVYLLSLWNYIYLKKATHWWKEPTFLELVSTFLYLQPAPHPTQQSQCKVSESARNTRFPVQTHSNRQFSARITSALYDRIWAIARKTQNFRLNFKTSASKYTFGTVTFVLLPFTRNLNQFYRPKVKGKLLLCALFLSRGGTQDDRREVVTGFISKLSHYRTTQSVLYVYCSIITIS